jgi:hypothetical protein
MMAMRDEFKKLKRDLILVSVGSMVILTVIALVVQRYC